MKKSKLDKELASLPNDVQQAIKDEADAAQTTTWRILGICGMDTARLLIADPCYVLPPASDPNHECEIDDYSALTPLTGWKNEKCVPSAQINYKRGHPGAGILIDSPDGDGTVTIYGKVDANNHIRAVFFSFDGEVPFTYHPKKD